MLLGFEFGIIQLGNQVTGMDLGAFIHRQLLDSAHDLGTDHHLIGVNNTDQLQVAGMIVEENEIEQGDNKDDSDQNQKFLSLRHLEALLAGPASLAAAAPDGNNVAATTSMTAALRSAMRCAVSGLRRLTIAIMGALLK